MIVRSIAREHPSRSSVSRKLVIDQHGRICVRLDVLLEVRFASEHVTDEPTDERDVATGPDTDELVGDG